MPPPDRAASFVAITAAHIASLLGSRGNRTLTRFNRHVTNRTRKLWAPHLRHAAVIEHRGRKTGKTYQTPVMAFIENGRLSVVLNYGERCDWARNVMAASSAVVVNQGNRYTLSDPHVIPLDSPELPAGVQAINIPERRALHGTLLPA
jgi:deazaflavin-dependent oxidoreductase (nitroreductase family)